MTHSSDDIMPRAPRFPRGNRRRTHPEANLHRALSPLPSPLPSPPLRPPPLAPPPLCLLRLIPLPSRPSPALCDRCGMFSDIARDQSEVLVFSEQKANIGMDEGRKRVLAIVAGILVARHLKTPEDLGDSRPSPRTESLIASAVQWADRIMTRIDGVFGNSPGNGKR